MGPTRGCGRGRGQGSCSVHSLATLSSTYHQETPTNVKAFDSLRSLVSCESSVEEIEVELKAVSELTIKQEPISPDLEYAEILNILQSSQTHHDGSIPKAVLIETTSDTVTCKLLDPQHLQPEKLIKKEPSEDVEPSENSGDSPDKASTKPIKKEPFEDSDPSENSGDSPDKASTSGNQHTPASSTDNANVGMVTTDPGLIASVSSCDLNLSGATLTEVFNAQEVNDMILQQGAEERDGPLTFDSLRQLASSFIHLKETVNKSSKARTRRAKGRRKLTCDECGYKSATYGDLLKHVKYKHGPKIYPCRVKGCKYTTKYPNNVKHHMDDVHCIERKFKCPECSKSFKRKNHLDAHMVTHSTERPFACNQCDYRAKRQFVLTEHIKMKHSDERPYSCDVCQTRTKTLNDMNKHKRIHTTTKEFVCSDCDRAFAYKTRLLVHQRNMHSTIKPTLFKCPYKKCMQYLRTKTTLQHHIEVIHKGIREFKCDMCGNAYGSKSALIQHMLTHDPTERPYKCPLCPFLGKEENYVRLHMSYVHKGVRPYNCDLCHVRFKKKSALLQHHETEKHQRNTKFTMPPEDKEVKPGDMKSSLVDAGISEGQPYREIPLNNTGEEKDPGEEQSITLSQVAIKQETFD